MSNERWTPNPAQKGCADFLLVAFAFMAIPPSCMGLMLLSTFFYRPELRSMPDQYGRVWSDPEILIKGGALFIVPIILYSIAYNALTGAKRGD